MKEILSSIRRTPYQSIAAFLVLFFTTLLSTAIFMSLSFLFGFLTQVETRPQVVVFFQTKTSENDIFKLKNELMNTGKLTSTKYVSKKDAFNIYKESNKNTPLLMEMTPQDLLPASLELNAKKPEYLPQIASFLKNKPGVDEVQFNKDILDKLLSLTSTIRKISFILFSYLIFMAIMVFVTIILFKIALKKEEIEVLRLLGANSFYIRKPFLKEGAFFGLTTAILAYIIILGSLWSFSPAINGYLRGSSNLSLSIDNYTFQIWPLSWEYLLLTLVLSCLFGVGIALIATFIATSKYID
jgi:cell division transport system permease protein